MSQTNPFARWLDATMERRGLSQAALAREMGVGDAQISRWRRGQVVPTVRSLQRLADTLGVPRATLDRLAGYPVGEAVAPPAGDDGASATAAEHLVYQAWFGDLLERKVPPELWRAYIEACGALADAFSDAFRSALSQAQRAASGAASAAPATDPALPKRPDIGFRG